MTNTTLDSDKMKTIKREIDILSTVFGWYGCSVGAVGALTGAFVGPSVLLVGLTHVLLGVAFFVLSSHKNTLRFAVCSSTLAGFVTSISISVCIWGCLQGQGGAIWLGLAAIFAVADLVKSLQLVRMHRREEFAER